MPKFFRDESRETPGCERCSSPLLLDSLSLATREILVPYLSWTETYPLKSFDNFQELGSFWVSLAGAQDQRLFDSPDTEIPGTQEVVVDRSLQLIGRRF